MLTSDSIRHAPVGLPRVPEVEAPSEQVRESSELSGVFDIDVAKEFTGDDPQLLVELLNSMLEETPRLMERMSLAIAQSDRRALRIEAHTLKGSAEMLGASDASAAAAKLESAHSDVDLDSVGNLHANLQMRVAQLMDALEIQSRELRNS